MRTRLEIETAFGTREDLEKVSSFYLVGIGGAGMSAVARMLAHRGYRVRGEDASSSEIVDLLRESGIGVAIGESGPAGLDAGSAVVLSDAIDLDSSLVVSEAREKGLPLFRRSQVLGWLLRDKKTIAVAGTHGKTTTTSFLALGMRAAGLDPTVVVGAEVPELDGAVSEGSGEFAVVEACEAYDSLRDFDPWMIVLTNLEPDHLDFHGSWENLRDSVVRFVSRLGEGGGFIYNLEDAGCREVLERWGGVGTGFSASDLAGLAGRPVSFRQQGSHNRANAAAALAALTFLGVAGEAAVAAMEGFGGARRRQEVIFEGFHPGVGGEITVLDDYGHHPTEVSAALEAVREGWIATGKRSRLVVVFQPHLYSRTAPNIDAFAAALDAADLVVLTDIYPAREAPMPGISSFRIAEKVIKPVHYVPSRHLLPREVAGMVRAGDVVVGMGAGTIEHFAPALVSELWRRGDEPRIWIAYGGDSTEREVSLHSGRAVYAAAVRRGFRANLVDLTEMVLGRHSVEELVGFDRPDLVVLTTHGGNGENGALQGFLEFLHIPYTGPGVRASAVAISKAESKRIYEREGMPVAKGTLLRRGDALPDWEGPYVVKPNSHGSTVGLSFVDDRSGLAEAVERCFHYDVEVLVEEVLRGVEVSVPVLGDRALRPVEVVPASGRYDFASKYETGATEEICPARISAEMEAVAMDYALRAHRALGCEGVTRTDMFVEEGRVVVVETNTVPGMTPTSLVPRSALEAGMSFDDVVEWMIRDGLETAADD